MSERQCMCCRKTFNTIDGRYTRVVLIEVNAQGKEKRNTVAYTCRDCSKVIIKLGAQHQHGKTQASLEGFQ